MAESEPSLSQNMPILKLSICIATYNRAFYLAQLLESIVSQIAEHCEVIVSDNASTDETEQVARGFERRCKQIRYLRQTENLGVDRNFDRAVASANGEYCWLMADDDVLKPTAIAKVLACLQEDLSLVVVNYERRNLNLSRVLLSRYLDVESDRLYKTDDFDRLFVETADLLIYIGCIVIKRSVWMERNRERYYGSMLMYLGVIFQARLPAKTLLIAEPLIIYRDGNVRTFWNELFEIFAIKWPALVWTLAPSESAKVKVCSKEPWRDPSRLLINRAMGFYSLREYRYWVRPRLTSLLGCIVPALIASVPGVLVNTAFIVYYSITWHRFRAVRLLWLRQSRFYIGTHGPFGRTVKTMEQRGI